MATPSEMPARINIGAVDGLVRIESESNRNPMNGTDELDFAFSLRPQDAIELGRRLIGAGLKAMASIDAEVEEKRKAAAS